jgi:hypothetical protein
LAGGFPHLAIQPKLIERRIAKPQVHDVHVFQQTQLLTKLDRGVAITKSR